MMRSRSSTWNRGRRFSPSPEIDRPLRLPPTTAHPVLAFRSGMLPSVSAKAHGQRRPAGHTMGMTLACGLEDSRTSTRYVSEAPRDDRGER